MSMDKIQTLEELYHLVLVTPDHKLALIDKEGQPPALPSIGITTHKRPAEQITSAIFNKWAFHSLVIDWVPGKDGGPNYAVMEVLHPNHFISLGLFRLHPLDTLKDGVAPDEVLVIVKSIAAGDQNGRGPFSRLGWLQDAKEWIRDVTHQDDFELTETLQLNASSQFALIRIATSTRHTYWLKAVGSPNTHEYVTTEYLAHSCPAFLPKVLAFRRDWNAWIMENFGDALHDSVSLVDFERAARKLASLQRQLADRGEELIAAQFRDHRIAVLASRIDELVEYLDEAMRQQTSTKAPALSSARLKELGQVLHEACAAMNALDIPDSVLHSDISPGSILSDGTDCVFTDWCEAYVGNPFITFEQLCVHAMRRTSQPELWQTRLVSAYKSRWSDILTDHQIDGALRLAPLISVLSYLYGRGEWLNSPQRCEPRFQSYSRSLARHIDRLAHNLGGSEVI